MIADIIESVKGLTIEDRIIFCAAPSVSRLPGFERVVVSFAECVANAKEASSNLLDIPTLPLEILDKAITVDREYLAQLETLHKALILYIWLSYRFPGVFRTQPMAVYVKWIVEEKIDKVLAQMSSDRKQKLKSLRQLAMLEELSDVLGDGNEMGNPFSRGKGTGNFLGGQMDNVFGGGMVDEEKRAQLVKRIYDTRLRGRS